MLLCLDVGNTHILGGVYADENTAHETAPVARFRYATHMLGTADQFGIFLLNVLHANHIAVDAIKAIAVCSVVPSWDFTLRHAFSLYFKASYFELRVGVKTGLQVNTKNPNEVGADLIAGAIGACHAFPDKNIIVIDMGTATTLSAIAHSKHYLGVTILPGLRLAMESLGSGAAKLGEVDISIPDTYLGRNTRESIQAGLYYGHLGALQKLIPNIRQECFGKEAAIVIGTGGFCNLYRDKNIFDVVLPDLVLQGLCQAYTKSITVS